LGRRFWGNGVDDGSDAAECAVDVAGFAADGAGAMRAEMIVASMQPRFRSVRARSPAR
jgi:hypothetical protein